MAEIDPTTLLDSQHETTEGWVQRLYRDEIRQLLKAKATVVRNGRVLGMQYNNIGLDVYEVWFK